MKMKCCTFRFKNAASHCVILMALAIFGTPVFVTPVLAGTSETENSVHGSAATAETQNTVNGNAASIVVKNFYAELLATMKNGESLGFAGRFKKLKPVIEKSFDMAFMTRIAVGPAWANASKDEQKQLIDAFTSFSAANYAHQFTAYDGETFKVLGEKPAKIGGLLVETSLTPKQGDQVVMNYVMRKDDQGRYRIVDVLLDSTISQLATRRAEFSEIVKQDGFNALANKLTEKSKQLGPS